MCKNKRAWSLWAPSLKCWFQVLKRLKWIEVEKIELDWNWKDLKEFLCRYTCTYRTDYTVSSGSRWSWFFSLLHRWLYWRLHWQSTWLWKWVASACGVGWRVTCSYQQLVPQVVQNQRGSQKLTKVHRQGLKSRALLFQQLVKRWVIGKLRSCYTHDAICTIIFSRVKNINFWKYIHIWGRPY